MLRISLRPSWLLATLLAGMHAAASGCAFIFWPGLAGSLAVGSAIAAAGLWHIRRDALLMAPDSPRELTTHADGRFEFVMRNRVDCEGRILASTFVSRSLVVITAKLETGRVRSIVVMPDSADAEDRRRLRVMLRHGVRTGSGSSGSGRL
jgi:toxin CptA